jgi:tripartite-type tricarboxylate transporter receptor subunit TctC
MKQSTYTPALGITRRRALAASLALTGVVGETAFGQDLAYPTRTVRIIVPSSPGGSLDAVARVIAERLSAVWKQPVIVENKAGANFAIGTSYVTKAPADGYTLLYAHDGVMAMNPVLYPKLSYDPIKELTPIGRVVDLPLVLYVNRDRQFRNVAEFVQALRAAPGKFNHASGGTATMLTSELFKSVAGVQYADVPYKGGGPAVTAVAAGDADFTFADPGSAAAMLQGERIYALATASPKRLRLQPKLPSIAETIPGYGTASWSGLHAPAGTPTAVIQRISVDLRRILAEPGVRTWLDAFGVEVHPSSPEELESQIRADLAKWARLVKEKNIQVS